MRIRAALTALAVLALAPAGAAQAASPKAQRCTGKGAKTIAKNRHARVFTTNGPGQDEFTTRRLFGCMYSTGRRVLLAEAYDDDLYSSGAFSQVRPNGRFVAWQYEAYEGSCKADCPPDYEPLRQTINIADLRTRRADSVDGSARPGTLAVGRRGSATWLDGATGEPRSTPPR